MVLGAAAARGGRARRLRARHGRALAWPRIPGRKLCAPSARSAAGGASYVPTRPAVRRRSAGVLPTPACPPIGPIVLIVQHRTAPSHLWLPAFVCLLAHARTHSLDALLAHPQHSEHSARTTGQRETWIRRSRRWAGHVLLPAFPRRAPACSRASLGAREARQRACSIQPSHPIASRPPQAKDDAERFELLIWASARGLLGDVSPVVAPLLLRTPHTCRRTPRHRLPRHHPPATPATPATPPPPRHPCPRR